MRASYYKLPQQVMVTHHNDLPQLSETTYHNSLQRVMVSHSLFFFTYHITLFANSLRRTSRNLISSHTDCLHLVYLLPYFILLRAYPPHIRGRRLHWLDITPLQCRLMRQQSSIQSEAECLHLSAYLSSINGLFPQPNIRIVIPPKKLIFVLSLK